MPFDLSGIIDRTITNFGFRLESEPTAGLTIANKKVICSPGLKFSDDLGVNTSRRSGWLLSYKIVKHCMNNETHGDNFFLDWKSRDAMMPLFSRLSNSLIKLYSERKKMKVHMTQTDRVKITSQIYYELLGTAQDKLHSLCQDGFLVMRYVHEVETSDSKVVKNKVQQFIDLGYLPPIIATPEVMEYLHRTDLLNILMNDADQNSVNFAPHVDFISSTANESLLEQTFSGFASDIAHIEFEQETLIGNISNIMDKKNRGTCRRR